MGELTIGALASQAGVGVETIRFYQRQGLLRVPTKPSQGIRRYGTTDVERVRFIKSAQRLGFRLNEVAQLLTLEDGTHCELAAEIAAHRLNDVRSRLAHLLRVETILSQLISNCQQQGQLVRCPLITAILGGVEQPYSPDTIVERATS